MAKLHWSNEQLLARLYGIQPDDGHLDGCFECRRRWAEIVLRRRELLENPPRISAGRLEKQRRAILERIAEAPPRLAVRFAPALAAVVVLAVVLVLFHRGYHAHIPPDTADNVVFEDAFTLASGEEPEAVEPIQALFEVQP